ncbi:3-beta hydroxysteroid dehydrogenase [Streptomyces sp. SAT1]|uniref:SDR family oxidoreductase n=1 Tax=Streptomyces sp. SAT1 TaxID=1849967 RepID=UPI0007DDD711|nr:SDR family oxidoreductase [Streptomyces sp. SAT1]ANH95145.1 3-beta hydroxysteroid dehydrogenase [Streptomyces sp. SAT1]
MKLFVTGASGFIGSAVVPELLSAGHQVLGLARTDAAAAAIGAAGGEVLRGDLDDLDALRTGARAATGVVHLAFVHDFGDFAKAVRTDRAAIDAIGAVLAGTGKPFVAAATVPAVPGRAATEEDDPQDTGPLAGRAQNARAALGLAARGVRSAVVRLPHTVHAEGGRGGFAGALFDLARRGGVSGYVGDGSARWPAVHVRDAARLFRIAVEEAPAGSVLHAVHEEGVTLLDTATAIGRALSVPVRSVEADALGFLGHLATVDKPASSARTRQRFGWTPSGPRLLADLDPEGA